MEYTIVRPLTGLQIVKGPPSRVDFCWCVFSCKKRGGSVKKVYFCVLFYDISVERLSRVMLENVGVSQKTVENFGKNFYIRVIFLH